MTPAGDRWVLHLDMDAFFASVEQLTRPTLRGRPVLVGGRGGRGVVAGASYEARAFGARSAMPMHQARRLVGAGAVVVPPRGAVYRAASRRVFDVVRSRIPVIEMLSYDEAFGEPAELAGASADDARAFAEELRTDINRHTGLTASVGLGSGKQIAKIASGAAKPDGVLAIDPDRELAYLHALPVRKLWGIGPVSGDRLARLGIETIGDFAALDPSEAASVLGAKIGAALHELARGIDHRPVHERAEAKQISSESTLAVDIVALGPLREELTRAAADAHRRLLADGRLARTVVVKLKRADMSVLTRSATLSVGTSDLHDLTAAAQRLALDPLEIGPIRLVGVGYTGLTAAEQFTLFDSAPDDAAAGPDLDEDDFDSAFDGAAVLIRAGGDPVDEPAPVSDDESTDPPWATGSDVRHDEFGHGWVQGTGHGVVTVRFETRATGPGIARTFSLPEPALRVADPLDSLAWDPGQENPVAGVADGRHAASVKIRRERPGDAMAIDEIHRSAFAAPTVNGDPGEVALVRALRAAPEWLPALSLVAVDGSGQILGHVCSTRGDLDGAPALGLGPLGVRADVQRAGVGSALMHATVDAAEALDEKVIVLLGDPGYYRRFGFVAAAEYGIVPDVDEWAGPAFQVRMLGPVPASRSRAVFRYAAPFYEMG